MKNKKMIKKIIVIVFLIILLILSFSKNFIFQDNDIFKSFQSDSEYLVISKIMSDKYMSEEGKYGLTVIVNEDGERIDNIYGVGDNIENDNVISYTSQVGLQGYVFSFMYNKLHISFWGLKLICCILLASVILCICYVIYNKYNKLMAGIFYITFLLSPWIVNFARNLYWVEFTWFLPVLLGALLSTNYNKKKIFVPLIFVAILIKCLCGYEYISTIMLATIAFFIIDFFETKDKQEKINIIKTILIVGLTCILSFLIALVIHANLRGEGNILEGVKSIYNNDILRRTALTSGADQFSGVLRESIDATVFETINMYFSWNTDVILGIDGKYFKLMFISTIAILMCDILKKEEKCYRDLVMFIVFLSATLSWFVLGKAHSYIHTHMNYVLWYFGFVQICTYIITRFICKKIYEIGKKE